MWYLVSFTWNQMNDHWVFCVGVTFKMFRKGAIWKPQCLMCGCFPLRPSSRNQIDDHRVFCVYVALRLFLTTSNWFLKTSHNWFLKLITQLVPQGVRKGLGFIKLVCIRLVITMYLCECNATWDLPEKTMMMKMQAGDHSLFFRRKELISCRIL